MQKIDDGAIIHRLRFEILDLKKRMLKDRIEQFAACDDLLRNQLLPALEKAQTVLQSPFTEEAINHGFSMFR